MSSSTQRAAGVGIIGYGAMGKVHAWGYTNIPFFYDPPPIQTRLVAVATSSQATAEAARLRGGFEEGTDDWRRLLERKDVDIVDICTPNACHAEQLAAALQAGKHVYCDKPLTASAEEATGIRGAMGQWSGVGQMALHNRFYSGMLRARQLVDEGFLGDPLGFRCVYLHSGSVDPSAPLRWKMRAADGGGVLRDLGSHALDLVDWLVGPIEAVRAESRILHAERPDGHGGAAAVDAEDQALITVRLAGGVLGTVEVSKIATGAEDDLRLELHGSHGALRFDLAQPDFVEAFGLSDPDQPLGGLRGWRRIASLQRYPEPADFPSPRATSGWLRGHLHCQYNFLKAVAEGATPEPSLERGVEVQLLLEAARRSLVSGAWERIPY